MILRFNNMHLLTSVCLRVLFNSLKPNDAYIRRQSNHHWFRKWLIAWSAPSHFLNQCWLLINRTQGTIFSEIVIESRTFSFKKMRLKLSSAKLLPFCLDLNVLTHWCLMTKICVIKSGHLGFKQSFVPCSASSHFVQTHDYSRNGGTKWWFSWTGYSLLQ